MEGEGNSRKLKILFVGTIPSIHKPNPDRDGKREFYYEPMGRVVVNGDFYQRNDPTCNCAGRIYDVNEFIDTHSQEVEYNFLIYDATILQPLLDPRHIPHIINHDLRKGIPAECVGRYDIVYIDTNTLGFIEPDNVSPEYWITFFKPLMNPKTKSCLIIDDTDIFPYTMRGNGYAGYLGKSIHDGLSLKVLTNSGEGGGGVDTSSSSSSFISRNKVFQNFINKVVRHTGLNAMVLIRVEEGLVNDSPSNLVKYKKEWDMPQL